MPVARGSEIVVVRVGRTSTMKDTTMMANVNIPTGSGSPGPRLTMDRRGAALLTVAGVMGPAVFWFVVIVDGFTKPGYDPNRDTISLLALGDRGWLQTANFIVVGVLTVAFAVRLRLLFPAGPASMWGPLLVALVGLGLVANGIFPADPIGASTASPSTVSILHSLAFAIIVVAIVAACLVFARRFRREPEWQGYGQYSYVTAIVLPALLVLTILSDGQPFAGLSQRVLVAALFVWIEVVALRALRLTVPAK